MADNQTGLNAQYTADPQFVAGEYGMTGLGGSPSPNTAAATAGPVLAQPVVSTPLASSQLPENMPRVPVTSGDTSGFSDDQPIHSSPLLPDAAQAAVTGIGHGGSIVEKAARA